MKKVFAALALLTLAAPALAASYPVAGKWGQSSSTEKGPVDCGKLRVVEFQGERRFDSRGGVPDYRAVAVGPQGATQWRITEEFRTGQVNGRNTLTLRLIDAEHLELHLQRGGTLKLRRCK